MERFKESTVFHGIVSLFRQVLVISMIVAVVAIALFWESLPASVKKTVTSLTTQQSENDVMPPSKFRIDYHPRMNETEDRQPEKVEYCNTQANDEMIDVALLDQLHYELKQLGATSCQLMYWGNKRNMFRFSCQIPVSEQHPKVTRSFQSIDPDAIQSIQEVIHQIRQHSTVKRADF